MWGGVLPNLRNVRYWVCGTLSEDKTDLYKFDRTDLYKFDRTDLYKCDRTDLYKCDKTDLYKCGISPSLGPSLSNSGEGPASRAGDPGTAHRNPRWSQTSD